MIKFKEFSDLPILDQVFISEDNQTVTILEEGKWIKGRFDKSLRIDQPTSGAGKVHAHIYGRKGDNIGAVNVDGTSSHGTKVRLHKKDAEELRARGFKIKPGNIVEWVMLEEQPTLLLE